MDLLLFVFVFIIINIFLYKYASKIEDNNYEYLIDNRKVITSYQLENIRKKLNSKKSKF